MPSRDQHKEYFTVYNSIKTPRVIRVIAAMLVIGIAIAVTFMVLTPWVQTTAGPGAVTSLRPDDRLQEINALVPGRIEEWYVRDGSPVKKGDPIVRIVDNDPRLIERLEAERDQLIARENAAKTAERTALLDLERTRDLFEQGLAARRELEQAQIRVEDHRARTADATAALARIDVSLSRQSAQIVRAPRDGMILRVNAGDTATLVNAGDVVAQFVPDGVERAVELFIDGRDVALIRPDDDVRLQFEGWPAIQFSGWPSMAAGTFWGKVAAVDPSADALGRFRILVVEDKEAPHPWPDDRYIRFGAKARGWVLLEEVKVGYEIWRQLNGFPPEFAETNRAVVE